MLFNKNKLDKTEEKIIPPQTEVGIQIGPIGMNIRSRRGMTEDQVRKTAKAIGEGLVEGIFNGLESRGISIPSQSSPILIEEKIITALPIVAEHSISKELPTKLQKTNRMQIE